MNTHRVQHPHLHIRWILVIGLSVLSLTSLAYNAHIDTLLNLSEAAIRREAVVESIRHLTEARKLVESDYDAKQDFWVNYYLGVSYFIVSEYDRALSHLNRALELCQRHHLDESKRSRTLNAIAGVYFDQKDYDHAWRIVKQDISRPEVIADSSYFVTCATDLALIANKRRQFQIAKHYITLARQHVPHDEKDEIICRVEVIEAERLHLTRRYDQLLRLTRRLVRSPHIHQADLTIALTYLVEAGIQCGFLDEAERAAQRAFPMATLKQKPELYDNVAKLYERKGDFHKAVVFKDSVIIFLDSIHNKTNHELAAKMQMRLEMQDIQNQTDKRVAQLIQHRRMLILLVCISLLLALVAILVMRNKNRQRRFAMQLRLEKEHQERQEAEYHARETEMRAAFQQQMMEADLEQKSRELSATSLFVNSRNELLQDLIQQLQDILAEHSSPALRGLVVHLQQLLKSSNEKDTLTINFEKTNPDFYRLMKQRHPDLTNSDLRFLSYIRMNMPTKDIAALLNVNPDSIKRRKIRLSHKLQLDSSTELYSYIQGM